MPAGTKGTYTGGASGVLYTDRRRFDLKDQVAELIPSATPFLTFLSKLRKEPTTDPDFE